jgi:hypothetical protein
MIDDRLCLFCQKILSGKHLAVKKYCTPKCRQNHINKLIKEKNTTLCDLNGKMLCSNIIGTISEFRVITDLMLKGYHVYRNVCDSHFCDLAIINGRQFLRIEVTTGYFSANGKLVYPAHESSRYDHLAICTRTGDLVYIPEIPDLLI